MLKRVALPYRVSHVDLGADRKSKDPESGLQRPPREPLSSEGLAFINQMAGKVSLSHTAKAFPHVINKLAPYGYRPPEMVRAIDKFLIDDRPERQGFPFHVVLEIGELRDMYVRFMNRAR